MRIVKKIVKWFAFVLIGLIVIANLAIIFTGRYYTYKGVASTYFRGHMRPHIYDGDIFLNRSVIKGIPQPWEESSLQNNTQKLTQEERKRMESLEPASFLVTYGDTLPREFILNGKINCFTFGGLCY
jgi:hypothetical protein